MNKHTVRDSHSETTEESNGATPPGFPGSFENPIDADAPEIDEALKERFKQKARQVLDESTGELSEAETSQAIVDSFVEAMAAWSERINAASMDDAQVERCCEAVSKFVREVKPC